MKVLVTGATGLVRELVTVAQTVIATPPAQIDVADPAAGATQLHKVRPADLVHPASVAHGPDAEEGKADEG